MQWPLFEQLDGWRRLQGRLLDVGGFGPREAPHRIVHAEPGVRLRRYEGGDEQGPAALIVPAPIKQPYIWDLAPDVSVVRRCLAHGMAVHLAEWTPAPAHFALDDYASRLILGCLDAARIERAVLLAHSLGGLFASIFAALHPERVQALVLLSAPLRFGEATPVFNAMVAQLDASDLPDVLPGTFLSAASLRAAPDTFGTDRMLDAIASAADFERLSGYLRVERWALDEFALPRRLVADLAGAVVREDRFARGALRIAGRTADPAQIRAPLLAVVDPRCRLVPPAAVLPVVEAAASRSKTVLQYEGDAGVALQHVGPLVGRNAHAELWPKILQWIAGTGVH